MAQTARNLPPILLLAPCAILTIALSACAPSSTQTATPAATVTVTETATPAAAKDLALDPSKAIDAADAWLLCFGATTRESGDSATVPPYTETGPSGTTTVTDHGDGSFTVTVPYAPASGPGAESICEARGTVGSPEVTLMGGRDFG